MNDFFLCVFCFNAILAGRGKLIIQNGLHGFGQATLSGRLPTSTTIPYGNANQLHNNLKRVRRNIYKPPLQFRHLFYARGEDGSVDSNGNTRNTSTVSV